jgi:hypothetical protein
MHHDAQQVDLCLYLGPSRSIPTLNLARAALLSTNDEVASPTSAGRGKLSLDLRASGVFNT